MTFDRAGNPIPPSREERARGWVATFMPLLAVSILLTGGFLCGWVLIRDWDTTRSMRAFSASPAAAARTPPELRVMAAALATMAAPTPTNTPTPTPEPTYTRLPTAVVIPCGMGSGWDDICVWPPPTPTPAPSTPVCVTPSPGDECLWRGRVTPTPGAVPWPANVVGA